MMPCVLIEGRNYSDLESSGQPVFFGEDQAMSELPPVFSDFFSDEIAPVTSMRATGKVIVLQPDEHELPIEQARTYLNSLPPTRSPFDLSVSMKTQHENLSIAREDWNQYFLDDGTMLFMRQVAKRVKVVIDKEGSLTYEPELSEPIAAPICSDRILGVPSTAKYSDEELRSSVVVHHLGFKRVLEATNEYVLWNNDKITLTLRLVNVSKTNKFNEMGEPIYLYDTLPTTGFIGPAARTGFG